MADVYEIVTQRFIEALEQGIIPWRQEWTGQGAPHNYVSRKAYSGGNLMLLWISAAVKQYQSDAWMTYNQATALGATVRKGEKATLVYFWKVSRYKAPTDADKKSFLLRYYNVFNVAQIDGLPVSAEREIAEIEAPQAVVDAWIEREVMPIRHAGSQAFYSPSSDRVTMPPRNTFKSSEAYYGTMFHELVHATGHASRLDRGLSTGFGSEKYSKEELVAEIGAAMLCAVCGIDTPAIQENSKAYVQNWIGKLKGDSKLILAAASQAQRAANYIRGIASVKYNDAEDDGAEDSAACEMGVAA
jgi:antirestriction protein ArdC